MAVVVATLMTMDFLNKTPFKGSVSFLIWSLLNIKIVDNNIDFDVDIAKDICTIVDIFVDTNVVMGYDIDYRVAFARYVHIAH